MLSIARPQAFHVLPQSIPTCPSSDLPRLRHDKSDSERATQAMVRGERRSSHGTTQPHLERHDGPGGRVINVRVSMEDYYENRRESVELDQPPSYDAFLLPDAVLERRKYNIQPRPDEGREQLPPYSCAISLETVFQRKSELEGAIHRAVDRNWNKVFATLQGTALSFYRCKGGSPFNLPSASLDMPAGVKKGTLIKSYNLQHADVGIASDYHKKRYVIRVRAEADQFLLSCQKIETFVLWLQSLFTAIDLALPLDDRTLPRDLSIPRPRRRRPARTTQLNMDRNTALVAEQEEIIRRQYPQLAVDRPQTEGGERRLVGNAARTAERRRRERERERQAELERGRAATIQEEPSPRTSMSSDSSSSRSSFVEDNDLLNTPAPPTRSNSSTSSLPVSSSSPMTRAMAARSLSDSATTVAHPCIEPDTGKWQPYHQWGPLYDMQYAKRCMAILTERSPRKSNLAVIKGRLWLVDWATGRVERYDPPSYEELMKAKKGHKLASSKLKFNQNGVLVAV